MMARAVGHGLYDYRKAALDRDLARLKGREVDGACVAAIDAQRGDAVRRAAAGDAVAWGK